MTDDPYRLDPVREPTTPARRENNNAAMRVFLWIVLVLAASANLVASLADFDTLMRLGFGLVSVLCIVALVVDHLRKRR